MATTYQELISAFGSDLKANQKIEIMTTDGGHIIQDHTLQVEEEKDHLIIWNPAKAKKIMIIYDEHIVGVKLR
jgi:hypothetical protein